MHPAPSLLEVFSKNKNDPRASHQQPMSAPPDHPDRPSSVDPQSPPLRKGTGNSTSTAVSAASVSTVTSASTGSTGFTAIEPATFTSANANHAVFNVKEAEDGGAPSRRASRRRTGPLSPEQRQKAALIRKIGACEECKRRRVACQLGHHGLSEEEARKKYMPRSSPPEPLPIGVRPTPGTAPASRPTFVNDHQPMDVDLPPGQLPLPRLPASDARNRTPLPTGRSGEKLPFSAIDSNKHDPVKADLQHIANRVLNSRSRYTAANALLITWEDETNKEVAAVVKDLADVFKHSYQYSCESVTIPVASDNTNPSLWLQGRLVNFMSRGDNRDSLKIVYYNGHSCLDANRKMVITSPARTQSASSIQWTGIQQAMEDASSDTLCIMDAPYFPSAPTSRQKGVLELLAACNAEDHATHLGRTTFSRVLADELRSRVNQNSKRATTAAELHANLLAKYANLIHDQVPEQQPVTRFPSPLYLQRSGNPSLPSIQLSPLNGRRSLPRGSEPDVGGRSFEIVLHADREKIQLETWQEWLRQMPEGIMNIKIDRPMGNDTLR